MDWVKKHGDTILVLAVLFGGWWNLNNRFVDLDKRMNSLEIRLTRIETVMVMQKIMPQDLVLNDEGAQ